MTDSPNTPTGSLSQGEREQSGDRGETIADLEAEGTNALRIAEIDNPRHEARLLLQHATGLSKETLIAHSGDLASRAAASGYRKFIRRRSNREPIAYILGRREFWSLDFQVSPAVLIPRPDSETLIEAALSAVPDRNAPVRVLDLGTGTGCLLLALLTELPQASGLGIDISAGAVALARENARALGLASRAEFLQGDWNESLAGAFDIIFANPPYIPEPDLHELERDVRDYEPHLALSGGPDGLDAYRSILNMLGCVLAPHGCAVIELGVGLGDQVRVLAEARDFPVISAFCDLAGHMRCLMLRGSAQKNLLE